MSMPHVYQHYKCMYTSGLHPLKKKKNSSDAGNALRWTSRWSPIVEKNGGKALPLDNPLEQCLLPLCSAAAA